MTDRQRLYEVGRAAARRFLENYKAQRASHPHRRGMTYDELTDHMILEAMIAVAALPRPRMSPHAIAAFERLVADMPDDKGDIRLVRQEMIGRAPARASALPNELLALLGNPRQRDKVLELLKTHGWGPLKRPKGRRNSAPVEYRYCPHHGADAEWRLYMSGKKGFQWRCWLCLQEAKARTRGQVRQQVQP